MNRPRNLLFFLVALSALCGYLLSKATLIGRTGINLFYTEYKFLKVWWQGGLVVFITLLVLFLLQGWVANRVKASAARVVHLAAILLALIGLYFTYHDFRHTLSHRLLGERFHLGGYLFWVGWLAISLFYLVNKRRVSITETNPSLDTGDTDTL